MKRFMALVSVFLATVIVCGLSACGNQDKIKDIDKPKTAATSDQYVYVPAENAVEESLNVNGMRFNMSLKDFTAAYNAEKYLRKETDMLDAALWEADKKTEWDDHHIEVQYWHYNGNNMTLTASVEVNTGKLVNIGCGTTTSNFMGMTGDKSNSDIILSQAALAAQVACGLPSESHAVLQDIFYRTATESNDTLWYDGFVFCLSTKEDKNDSKNNIMLFRVFPVKDELKQEWNLTEYK